MTQSAGLHDFLKAGTADLHARTDDLFGRIGFDTPAQYALFLIVQYEAFDEVEKLVAPYSARLQALDLQGAARGEALLADLRNLGVTVAVPAPEPDAFASLDEAAGAAYVLEGSRLGGRMLARMIRARLPEAPLSFLDYPSPPGFWQAYIRKLDEFTVEKNRWAVILSGAIRAFGAFETRADAALHKRGIEAS